MGEPALVYGPYGGRSKRDHYQQLLTSLKSERSSFDTHWQDIGQYILPRRTRFFSSDRNRGDKRYQSILDSTARAAARTLQSGLHAGLTSPARPWFKLGTPDPDLGKFGPVKEWLHVVTQRMQTVFSSTNLYNTLPVVYGDMGTFGTAAMSVVEDSKDLFRCYAYPLGSFVFGLDERNKVTTFMREYELTVRQIVQRFGVVEGTTRIEWRNISTAVKALWDQGQYESPIPVVWAVAPNPEADASRLQARYLPWSSCHFELGEGGADRKFLRESGFRSFPILGPRWDITGEDSYGVDCPGMLVLGDSRQLQGMQREKGKAVAKMVNPPLVGPVALRSQKTSLLPGDVTYVDQREGMSGLRSIHEVTLNLQHLREDIFEVQQRIKVGYYEDLFKMLADRQAAQPITAREVEERHEEKLLALGPVLERTNDELLDPLIDRAYEIMEAAGLIPEPPDDLNGVKLKVEYVSIMAQAQKLVGVVGQDRFLQTVVPMMEAFPEVRNKIRPYQIVDNYADMLGVDPRAIVPTEDAEAAQAQQEQQARAAQAAAIAEQGANAAKTASETKLQDGSSALDRVLAGA